MIQAYKKACIHVYEISKTSFEDKDEQFLQACCYRADIANILAKYYNVTDAELQELLNSAIGAPSYHF